MSDHRLDVSPPPREPVSGVPLLLFKLRTGGLAWLIRRMWREWKMPTTAPVRRFYLACRRVRGFFLGASNPPRPAGESALLFAFYDLGVAPITHDFLWFLVGAELERRRRALAGIRVVIVPGSVGGLREERPDYERVIGADERRARVSNVLIPACRLLPSVAGVTAAASRAAASAVTASASGQVFPKDYEPGLPFYARADICLAAARRGERPIGVLRATPYDLDAARRWLQARDCRSRVLTITLRSYAYMPARNSNHGAWLAFARRLDRTRYSAVFVPDTSQTLDGLPPEFGEFPVFSEAAWNIGLRMGLYEQAYLNLGVNNGPMGLCWLNERTRYITFKMLTESVPQTTAEYVASHGFELGASLPFATPYQRWVWEDDDLPVIEREFAAMVNRIEQPSQGIALVAAR